MHSRLYNQVEIQLRLKPNSPLLVKSGESGYSDIDPSLPDMSFVRTYRSDLGYETVYIPGSSFRGVLRGHAEKLIRSLSPKMACMITRRSCLRMKKLREKELNGPNAYLESCYACRLFGNTALASRVRVSDLYPVGPIRSEIRYGVAIDRVTNAVAHGPFQMEVVTGGTFEGEITLRNFTLGQLGLMAAAILDMADGFVSLGFGKSKGLGLVDVEVTQMEFRSLKEPQGAIKGIGLIADERSVREYRLPTEGQSMPVGKEAERKGAFYLLRASGDEAIEWLNSLTPVWVEEVSR
jgi:CRISPR/Cas system CSM-associated protein Csm3 (group 7 of RAMP superfamily)